MIWLLNIPFSIFELRNNLKKKKKLLHFSPYDDELETKTKIPVLFLQMILKTKLKKIISMSKQLRK